VGARKGKAEGERGRETCQHAMRTPSEHSRKEKRGRRQERGKGEEASVGSQKANTRRERKKLMSKTTVWKVSRSRSRRSEKGRD